MFELLFVDLPAVVEKVEDLILQSNADVETMMSVHFAKFEVLQVTSQVAVTFVDAVTFVAAAVTFAEIIVDMGHDIVDYHRAVVVLVTDFAAAVSCLPCNFVVPVHLERSVAG